MRKKSMIILLTLMAILVAAFGLAEESAADRTISFEENGYVVYVGRQQKLNVTVENLQETTPKQTQLVWTSSDQDVAAVNAGGMLNGKKAGKATITAAAKDNESISASVEVEVRVPVQSVQINEKNVSVVVGGKEEAAKTQLSAAIKPVDAFFMTGTWSSSNENVATVDSNGVVTGISAGNASITFTSDDPNGQKKAQTNIRVGQAVTQINAPAEISVHVRKGINLRPEVLPQEASNKKLEYVSSDPSVAAVSPAGQVTGVADGEATITCKATDGSEISAEVRVKVFQPVQNLKLDKMQLNAFVGKTSDPLVVTVMPADAKYQDYTWSSADESIATVNEKGEVTGIAGGRTQITATSNEPVTGNEKQKSVTCQVTVSQSVEYIWLEKNEKKSTDKKLVLSLTVLPETATNKSVVWTTSDKKIATVNNGVVTIRKREGTATITATAKDGSGIYASCDVSVGFSGTVIQIGSYVRRMGAYYWDVSNFKGNGVRPQEEVPVTFPEGLDPRVSLDDISFAAKENESNRGGKIFFRDMPWGIPYSVAEKTGLLDSSLFKPGVETSDMEIVCTKNRSFEVAGYTIDYAGVYFTYTLDETGEINKIKDDAILFGGAYTFRGKNRDANENIYNDLRDKLEEIYGSPKNSPMYTTYWFEHGVTLTLSYGSAGVTLRYQWDEGKELNDKVKEINETKEKEREENMATPVPESKEGL